MAPAATSIFQTISFNSDRTVTSAITLPALSLSDGIVARAGGRGMSWEADIEELRRREALARQMGGPEKVKRQHDGGKLTVRERIDKLLDPGSFHEIGTIAGKATYEDGELV